MEEARVESQKKLSDIMNKWVAAMSNERFFDEDERRIEVLESKRRDQLLNYHARATDGRIGKILQLSGAGFSGGGRAPAKSTQR